MDKDFKKIGIDLSLDDTAKIKHPHLVELGDHVAIDVGVYCSTQMKIGDYVHIAPYVCIIGGNESSLIMDDFSGVAAGSKLVCGSDNFVDGMLNPQVPIEFRDVIIKPIIFEKYACVGVNSVVLPGVTLAEGSILGANSLLTESTEPWMIYVGSPAKPVKQRNKESVLSGAKKLGY